MVFSEDDVTSHPDFRIIDRDLAAVLYRSYSAALTLLGNAQEAEALVIDAVENLDAEHVTSEALRDAVVLRLAQRDISTFK